LFASRHAFITLVAAIGALPAIRAPGLLLDPLPLLELIAARRAAAAALLELDLRVARAPIAASSTSQCCSS
jgi:hypothetical protein